MSIVLQKYGITLSRLTENDIELVRYWRNHESINQYMLFRDYITPEMQKAWFEQINTPFHYYMLITYNNEAIGVINVKNVNLEEGFGEGGIFIWAQAYWKGYVPTLASLLMLEFTFDIIPDFDFSVVRVLKSNIVATKYNKALGYVPIPDQNTDNLVYVLTRRKYKTKTTRLIRAAEKITGDAQPVRYFITRSPLNLDIVNVLANC